MAAGGKRGPDRPSPPQLQRNKTRPALAHPDPGPHAAREIFVPAQERKEVGGPAARSAPPQRLQAAALLLCLSQFSAAALPGGASRLARGPGFQMANLQGGALLRGSKAHWPEENWLPGHLVGLYRSPETTKPESSRSRSCYLFFLLPMPPNQRDNRLIIIYCILVIELLN